MPRDRINQSDGDDLNALAGARTTVTEITFSNFRQLIYCVLSEFTQTIIEYVHRHVLNY